MTDPIPQTTHKRDEAVPADERRIDLPNGYYLFQIRPSDMTCSLHMPDGLHVGNLLAQYAADFAAAMLASAPAPASGGVDAGRVTLFSALEAAYIRGAAWCAEMGMTHTFSELRKAAYDYADKEEKDVICREVRASLSPAATPVSGAGGGPYTCTRCLSDTWNDDDICDGCKSEADSALAKPASSPAGVRRVRHKKRGGIYEVLGEAQVQASRPLEDYEVVVIYRSLNTPDIDDPASPMKGDTWIRPKAEFNDGRFEELSQSTSAGRVGE